ncbi:hypothetical protein [uncultured Stenotrophomonas sp.]|uniref:hypothetical protein n=1 Tax=uncultured Stenotrophomonas sp. TaxID=165438 RepID=UPI0028EFCAF0|nr:hypothetical protein [uncultured Stenotrophomonas sp.]
MTPAERSQWCIQQAEAIEADLLPVETEEGLLPIGRALATWYRSMARRVLDNVRETA